MIAVDLFSGAGGFSEGAKQAGICIKVAANHWQVACDMHSSNHEETSHLCQDLEQADWSLFPRHDLLLAAPACQGHTPARGKEQPHHDKLRNTAWAVVSCAEYHRSDLIVVENVPAFLNWRLFPAWKMALEQLGYCVQPHLIDSADHGVPQSRVRVFIICTKSQTPLRLSLAAKPHQPIAPHILWDGGSWSDIDRPNRSPKTLQRCINGRKEFGDRFVFPYYSSGSGLTGRSIHRPIGTVTTKARWAVVKGDKMRMLNIAECKAAMGFAPGYVLPASPELAMIMLGNAVVPPVARDLLLALKAKA